MSAVRQFSSYCQPSLPLPWRTPQRTILLEKQISTSSTATVRRTLAFVPWRNLNHEMPLEDVLKSIENKYVIENRSEVAQFVRKYRLRGLLIEAIKPLDTFFGTDAIKGLALVRDDEGSESLYCLLMTPGEMEEANTRLRSFDEEWWLGNSVRGAGKLNFDFELI